MLARPVPAGDNSKKRLRWVGGVKGAARQHLVARLTARLAAFFRCRRLRWRRSSGQSGPSGHEATDFAVDECGLRADARNRSKRVAPGSSTRADLSWA